MRSVSFKGGRTGMVCGFILFQVAVGSAFAQSTEAPAAVPAPAADAANADAPKDVGPFGGCEPIGMTASGELVFPLECKHKIQLQPAPVASDDKAPPVDDKPVAAPEKAAATDTPAKTAEDKPAVEIKAASVEDKPVAPAAVDAKPAVATETLAATDKMPVPAEQKPVEAKPVEQAETAKVETAKVEATKVEATKVETTKTDTAKAEAAKPVKRAGRRAARMAANAAAKPGAVRQVAANKQVIAMAKPAQAVASAHAEEKPATVQTAGLLPCSHYRSYNAASKSYRGFDGRMYACR